MRILVTGGAGFVGSHLTKRLLAQGHSVVVVDNLSTGRKENIPKGAQFLYADLSRPDALEGLPKNIDAVCHLAAQSAGAVSAERPYYDLEANAGSTLQLTRWCLKNKVPRFVYASSMAAYGQIPTSPAHEETSCVPLSYYGASKLYSEHLLRLAAQEGLKVTSFRMFTIYGPGQDMGNLKQGMVSIYMAYLLKGQTVPVTGSLDRFRDIIFIDDVVNAWAKAVEMPETPSQIYNLASGKPTSVRELLAALKQALDMPSDHPVEVLPGTKSDQFGLYGDISRIQADLGFVPQTDLALGLRRMAVWARDNDRSASSPVKTPA